LMHVDAPPPPPPLAGGRGGRIWIVERVCSVGFAESKGKARRLVEQGAVSLDGERISDADAQVDISRERVLRVGKRRFARVVARG